HAEHEHPGVGAHATVLQGRPQSADQPREAPTGTIHGEPINETAVDATIHHRLGEPVDRTNDHGVVDLIDIVLVIEHAAETDPDTGVVAHGDDRLAAEPPDGAE